MRLKISTGIANTPTPMSGLALAIASLGWCWDVWLNLGGVAQWLSAFFSTALLVPVALKFISHPRILASELSHPVVGSVVPTFAMALMIVSHSVAQVNFELGNVIWLTAIALHVSFLISFAYHRVKDFELHHMVPSWFVPPIGIVVADVTFTGSPDLLPIAHLTLLFGLVSYAFMLPMMIYRLIFTHEVPDAAKPTIAIMAAPASLSLAGYLTVVNEPSPIVVSILLGIAVLMTLVIYMAFIKLLRLPFSPGYAAFTFPLVIGATALFKTAEWLSSINIAAQYVSQIERLAIIELLIATCIVFYVAIRYLWFYKPIQNFVTQ